MFAASPSTETSRGVVSSWPSTKTRPGRLPAAPRPLDRTQQDRALAAVEDGEAVGVEGSLHAPIDRLEPWPAERPHSSAPNRGHGVDPEGAAPGRARRGPPVRRRLPSGPRRGAPAPHGPDARRDRSRRTGLRSARGETSRQPGRRAYGVPLKDQVTSPFPCAPSTRCTCSRPAVADEHFTVIVTAPAIGPFVEFVFAFRSK